MSLRHLIARLILWRGTVPAFTVICTGLIIGHYVPGWSWWGVLLASLVTGSLVVAWFLRDSQRTGRVESLVAQLTRLNFRLNVEIAQRGRIEAELASARDEALEASRMKSQFLATMSHEIRTPMNGIIGMTDLLLDTRLTAEQLDYAESVRSCSETLMNMIDDILDFAKIDANSLKLDLREFQPGLVVESALDLLATRAAAKGLKLTRDLAELPDLLIGDPVRLRQMLVILIGNVIKFTEQGEVFVAGKVAEWTETSVTLRISIQDTGIGIHPEEHERLFQAFYQTDGSATRRYGGAGLGLAICKQLAEMMGGDIEMESQTGQGSTFHLTVRLDLPAEDEAAAESTVWDEKIPVAR